MLHCRLEERSREPRLYIYRLNEVAETRTPSILVFEFENLPCMESLVKSLKWASYGRSGCTMMLLNSSETRTHL